MDKSLPVGDELNALLHEIFDGYQWFEGVGGAVLLYAPESVKKWTWFEGKPCERPSVITPAMLECINGSYLTGDGMIRLVEKLKADGYGYYLHYNRMDAEPESVRGWAAQFEHPHEYVLPPWDHADDAPTATAYAALRAKGILK